MRYVVTLQLVTVIYEAVQWIRPMKTAVELPYEVWLHILSFLNPDSETIRQLRFVNTLFYNLSLDEQHRITRIGYDHPDFVYPPLWCVDSGCKLDPAHS
jgi:hypothetical protein